MHYINQFFAGIGSEDKADLPVAFREEALGPGKGLQLQLGESAKIVVTVYCGDNYFPEHHDEALASILQIARDQNVQMLIAGPAFRAGRYGFACVEVCHSLSTSLGLDCVTGMNIENPGVDVYKQYHDRRVFLIPTATEITGMPDALSRMAKFASKLATGAAIGSASEEGYIPRGFRIGEVVSKSGVERAIDMLLDKLAGRPFATDIPVESPEVIPVPPSITNLKDACLALVSTGGIVPQGNPDGIKSAQNAEWRKYYIGNLDSMQDAKWQTVSSGYVGTYMNVNANYGVPLDVCREMEKEGIFARLYPYFYATTGNLGSMVVMQDIGKEMAKDIKAKGVDAVLLVAT